MSEVRSKVQGSVVAVHVDAGDAVAPGTALVTVESMKMEYPVTASEPAVVSDVAVGVGDQVEVGTTVATLGPPTASDPGRRSAAPAGPADGSTRADLAEVLERHRLVGDAARPEAVAKRRARGQRTARENVDDLLDDDSLVEYGPLLLAAQRGRMEPDELIRRTPADGLVAGVGTVDGSPVAVLAYDATVLAGTQGHFNHLKKDRLLEVAQRRELPTVIFAEGGGGRPGDTDVPVVSGLDVLAFRLFARLSGSVPLVGVASGRCFAGNAALLGCCDVIIATEDSNIGMGGPAMIEGGGLGVVAPEQIGPIQVQAANGVVDVQVADEAAAVDVARRYLSYFTSPRRPGWTRHDASLLRDVVPPQRRTPYDVRRALELLADVDSVLELRRGWSPGMVTALARVEGRSVGIVANDPMHLAGAIDADGADKAARFLQLCDAHRLPVLLLCDTPGFMVGTDAEERAAVRHVSRMFVTGANISVPFGTIVLRKAYGLGAMAMAGGTFKAPLFCVAWPTGELGGMGLEGAVRLGFRKELDAVQDPAEREALYERMVAAAYENGKAINTATILEIDDVIDPADSLRWIRALLDGSADDRGASRRSFIDTW